MKKKIIAGEIIEDPIAAENDSEALSVENFHEEVTMSSIRRFIDKVRGFLIEPTKTFNTLKDSSFLEALLYNIILAIVYSALLSLSVAFFRTEGIIIGPMMGFLAQALTASGEGIVGASVNFIALLITWIIWIIVTWMSIHIGVCVMGGEKGFTQTYKAFTYGITPVFLFGWIPNVSIISGIWSVVIIILGIQELHELTINRAIMSLIMAFLIPLLIIISAFILL